MCRCRSARGCLRLRLWDAAMIRTSEAPKWIVIVRNILISASLGILFGCLLFPWLGAVLQALGRDNYALFNVKFLLMSTLTSPFLVIFIMPILLPLIGAACLAGVVLQKSIEKHLVLWCVISPIFIWLTMIAILIQTPQNSYYAQFTKFERFLIEIPSADHFIYLMAASFSSFVFFRLSRDGFKW